MVKQDKAGGFKDGRISETLALDLVTWSMSECADRTGALFLCVSADRPLSFPPLLDFGSGGVSVDGPDDWEAGARTPG